MKTHLLLATCLSACALNLALASEAPIEPDRVISLFNGKDLSNFITWDVKHGFDDKDRVFTVVEQIDGAPAIRISGQHYGSLITKENYANYRFVCEFRWGQLTWAPRRDRTMDGGVLFHCQGLPGNNTPDRKGPYMRSVEYQLIEGGSGDLILIGGYDPDSDIHIFPNLHTTITPGTRVWNPDGVPVVLTKGRNRTDWRYKDPNWTDVLGFRGARDVEKPVGEWNLLEATIEGGSVTFFLNGVKVNEGRDGSFRFGQILFQSEGAEMFFRNVELHPLPH